MRTTFSAATVRLYHLDGGSEGGSAHTLHYGSLTEAMRSEEHTSELQSQ